MPQLICKTPDAKWGVCLPISLCRGFSSYPVEFLTKSRCKPNTADSDICCPATSQPLLLPPGSCGRVGENRIIGGKETAIYDFPWTVLVEYTNGKLRDVLTIENKNFKRVSFQQIKQKNLRVAVS